MFKLTPCTPEWGKKARFYVENIITVPAGAEDLFDVIAGKDEKEWFPGFLEYHWLSDEPQGVGSVRDYRTESIRLIEHFLIWDRGTHFCFTVSECSKPFFKRFMEDYIITTISDGECRLQWRIYYEPTLLIRMVHKIMRSAFKNDIQKAANNLAAYFEKRKV
ncbi:MAG: SRPBCC family protein [bacterium]|nr:SRPBCC family protein [bacterium]